MPLAPPDNGLKIMMLSQRMPPESCTGAPLQAWHLSRALAQQGHRVEVTTSYPWGISHPPRSEPPVVIHAMAYPELPGLAQCVRFFRAAARRYPAVQWDVVHGHALSPMILGAALGKNRTSAPMLVKPSIGGGHAEGEVSRIRASMAYPLFRRALQKIDMFAVLDELIEQDLEALGVPPERRWRVDNGIDLQAYQPATEAQRSALREQYRIAARRVLLFCGQLSERKGVAELLNAWSDELYRRHDTVLLVCGDGPLRERVQRESDRRDGVMYLGPVSDTTQIVRMADVLILPSRWESFGNVIMEAMASGVPVAATPCGVAPRVLAGERCGWLIAESSTRSIERALQRIFADRSKWREKGIEASRAAQRFSIDRIARDYVSIYREMARRDVLY